MVIKIFGVIAMTLLGSLGAIGLKKASSAFDGVKKLLKSPAFWLGIFAYAVSSVLNIWLLKVWDYSIVMPLSGITYVWTAVASKFLYKENITVGKITGIAIILIGTVLVALS